jgi:superfamily I DNA/RNA helicase
MELDEEQRYAVESDESLVVIAGPGSGKTRVLTEKARKLFSTSSDLICLCFTRAAASEMRSRVEGLPATTIHSFCYNSVGWEMPKGGDQQDGHTYMLQRFLWGQKETPTQFSNVLVDECQDLNPLEFDVAVSMAKDKIFAVGDPYQSIYGFQGAIGTEVVDRFKDCGCRDFALHSNYRSCPEIVKRLNNIYSRNLVSKNTKDTGLTAILCRRNDDVFEVSGFLKQSGIPHRVRLASQYSEHREYEVLGASNLILSTVHVAKGREFDHVVLYGWLPDSGEDSMSEEWRIFYVACSRASKKLDFLDDLEGLPDLIEGA